MDDTDIDGYSDQYYSGQIYCASSSHGGCFTFFWSDERDSVRTQTLTRRSKGSVQSFQ